MQRLLPGKASAGLGVGSASSVSSKDELLADGLDDAFQALIEQPRSLSVISSGTPPQNASVMAPAIEVIVSAPPPRRNGIAHGLS
jgi:hypothetical protein